MNSLIQTQTSNPENATSVLNENVEKVDIGVKRGWIQIKKTISFEFLRNATKLLAMLVTAIFIYALFFVIRLITAERSGVEISTSIEYVQNYLTMIDLFILIVAVTFFGSIIAEDFEKDTGNLLFPKIPKERLLIGRYIARYVYGCLSVAFFYLLVGITSLIKYQVVPKELWGSMLWAEFYLFGVSTFITLFSSFMKRSSTAMITGILFILIVFQLLNMIFMFSGITVEPFYFLTYYSNIITAWFDMPLNDDRFREMSFRPGMDTTYYQWSTPSPTGAIIGLSIYIIMCLAAAYILYRRRK